MRPALTVFATPEGPSRQALAVVRALSRSPALAGVDFVEVIIDEGYEGLERAARAGVHAVPTILIHDEEGSEVRRLVGFQTRPALERALAEVV